MDCQISNKVVSLDELVLRLREIFEKDEVDIEYVKDLMKSYQSNPLEWKKYSKFDPHKYTRNLVDSGNGKYNLIVICWGQGQGSAIHDHANSHCFMKILNGSMCETRFEWPKKDEKDEENEPKAMKVIEEHELQLNEVAYINDKIGLHRMENKSHSIPGVSLHLYTPPITSCKLFDQRTGHENEVIVTLTSFAGKQGSLKVKEESGNNQKHVLRYNRAN